MNSKVEIKKPPDNLNDFFKCVKIPIKHVLKNPDINASKISDAVIKCNKIVIHTLMFIKLYLLDYYDKHNNIPNINDDFVNSCMKILCNDVKSGRPPSKEIKELKDKLTIFYNKEYKPLIQNDPLDYTNLNTVLDYLTTSIITMYENNIKLHFIEYIERFVNVINNKKEMLQMIKDDLKSEEDKYIEKELINYFCKDLRNIKNDILNIKDDKFKSKISNHQWIKDIKNYLIFLKLIILIIHGQKCVRNLKILVQTTN